MATQAHCAYCFESLAASLERRPSLSLEEVETLWEKYNTATASSDDASEAEAEADASADRPYKPAALSRLLAPSPSTTSSSSLQSALSTPSGTSTSSSATSSGSSLLPSLSNTNTTTGPETQHPLFVTWNTISPRTNDARLHGCIGTFSPLPLSSGLRSYALTSAFDDTRFSPITLRELPSLSCAVTLLTDFEDAEDTEDWEVGLHGLRISFEYKGRRLGATYLPDVAREQGWSREEAVVSLMRKAGWGGRREEWRGVRVKGVRYQGKKVSLGYEEWREWREWVEEEMGDC